ncbi:Methyltransferase [uncultured virus]|nr:Methyltransferase [uncultured virus]
MNDWIENITSTWKGHREFATWLVSELKPKEIVELGVTEGYSTFRWATANAHLNSDGMVTGIDQNVHESIYNHIINHGLTGIEIVETDDFAEAAVDWDRKVEIVHLHGDNSREVVNSKFVNWIALLAEDGILMFHGVNVGTPEVGAEGWFNDLQIEGYKKGKFQSSNGLGILTKNLKLFEKIVEKYPEIQIG